MNLISKLNIKTLLKKYSLRPSKRLGQNFLIDKKMLSKIIKAADLSQNDLVLEIGPGLGGITQALAQKVKKVIAVEKDKRLIEALKEVLKDYKNIEIIQGDILKIQGLPLKTASKGCHRGLRPCLRQGRIRESDHWTIHPKEQPLNNPVLKFIKKPYKFIANLPYYITAPTIRMFLESKNPPQEMILLVQKEVGQRICARPPQMNLLAVAIQLYSQPKIISYISKKSFWPQPKVNSAIVKINQIEKPEDINTKKFFKTVKAGFASPRKQLINNLSQGLNLEKGEIKKALAQCRLDTQVRAENLSIDNWKELIKRVSF